MQKQGKLELTWVGKYEEKKIEPRILVEDKTKSYGDPNSENMLIHGDNLLALKALEQEYTGRIKCIYIDPPYNTGSAFEYYEDGLAHSEWLNMMRSRLEILQSLLTDNGSIWIQIDDEEQAYLKVLCDEIFGRENFVNMISVNMKNIAGASGGGEDKRLKKNCEYILIYAKDYECLDTFKGAYDYEEISELVERYREEGVSWKYTSVFLDEGEKKYIASTLDGDGNEIRIFEHKNYVFKSISAVAKENSLSEKEVYYSFAPKIVRTTMPQSSIRPRVMAKLKEMDYSNDLISIQYTPKTGKNKGIIYTQYYKGDKYNLFAWLSDVMEEKDGKLYKKTLQGTYWDFIAGTKNLTKEGSVEFPNGKKPESLVQRILSMATDENDIVLDSFAGSGTTAATAHKLNRKWITIELGNHAYTHCKLRMDKVIDGEQGGISKAVNWQGGGGYHFYELAPSLLVPNEKMPAIKQINPEYTFEQLCEAICKIEGFKYKPEGRYHGYSSEKRFIHIAKEFVNGEYVNSLLSVLADDESILIYGTKIQSDLRLPDNVEVKRIPKNLLDKCTFESEVR